LPTWPARSGATHPIQRWPFDAGNGLHFGNVDHAVNSKLYGRNKINKIKIVHQYK
jgi:hypothetical protein